MSKPLRTQELAEEPAVPAKRLALHTSNVRASANGARPAKGDSRPTKAAQFDSANFEAAKRLRCNRLESGLTQEELAVIAGESVNAIARRERGEVWLGALRQVVVLKRVTAAKLKVVK